MNAAWLQRWRRANPLAVLALAGMAGLWAADRLAIVPNFWLGGACVAALAFACRRPRFWKFVPAAGLVFAFVHSARLSETYQHPLRLRLLAAPEQSERVTLRARLFPWQDGVELDAARAGAATTEMRWRDDSDFEPVRVQVKVVLPPGVELREAGLYEVTGVASLPRPPVAPGQFDAADYNLRMGWVAVVKADGLRLMKAEPLSPRFHLLKWAEASRQWVVKTLSEGASENEQGSAVVLAMTLGASQAAGDDVEEAFRGSGTLHVFAVSGLHVGMVALFAGFTLRWLGVGRARTAWLLVILVFFYAFLTGWRPSAARAAMMITFMLAAPLVNRQTALQNSLGAAAMALLAMDSHQFFLPGFQLSFGVLWAISVGGAWLLDKSRPWTELDAFLPSVLASRRQRTAVVGRRWLASLGSMSASAWTGSLPLILGHFQTLTPVALLANCVLVPMATFCISFSCISVCCAVLGLGSGQVMMNRLNAWTAQGMVATASWFADLPMASMHVKTAGGGDAPVQMRVFQTVGGGAANHLRHGNAHWLLDCGSMDGWRWILSPYLRHEGIDRLDGLILSHGDAGHAGAAPQVLKTLRVAELHTSKLEPWRYDPPFSSLRQLSRLTPPDGSVWRRHGMGDEIRLGPATPLQVTAKVLHPLVSDLYEKADDRGLVLLITVGSVRVLWLADAGFVTEKLLLERGLCLECDVLIRNQHSSDVSGLPELLLAAGPRAIISSNDVWRAEERMPDRVREFCAREGVELFDLNVCGSVGIAFAGEEARLEGFSNGQRATIKPRQTGARSAGK